jgi:hypothetical protein
VSSSSTREEVALDLDVGKFRTHRLSASAILTTGTAASTPRVTQVSHNRRHVQLVLFDTANIFININEIVLRDMPIHFTSCSKSQWAGVFLFTPSCVKYGTCSVGHLEVSLLRVDVVSAPKWQRTHRTIDKLVRVSVLNHMNA